MRTRKTKARRRRRSPDLRAWLTCESREPAAARAGGASELSSRCQHATVVATDLLIRTDPTGEFSPNNDPLAGCTMVSAAASDRTCYDDVTTKKDADGQ